MNFKLPHDVVCACAKRDKPPSQQAINIELPHDVVCACAKRDEPPSRRRPFRFCLDQNNILSTNSPESWPTSARHYSCRSVSIRGSLFKNDRLECVNFLLRHAAGQQELLDLDRQRVVRIAILGEAKADRIVVFIFEIVAGRDFPVLA